MAANGNGAVPALCAFGGWPSLEALTQLFARAMAANGDGAVPRAT